MITIPLTQGQVALIDDEDAALANLKWYAEKREQTYYATRNRPKVNGRNTGVTRLHIAIMGPAPEGMEIDHINRNGLDCRRSNLRFVTSRQNAGNTGKRQGKVYTPYKGVYWHKRNRVWFAQIGFGPTYKYLGQFKTDAAGARAYDAAALERWGACAYLNFPQSRAA